MLMSFIFNIKYKISYSYSTIEIQNANFTFSLLILSNSGLSKQVLASLAKLSIAYN